MKSLQKNNFLHNLIGAISILCFAIIMHSCEPDPLKGTSPRLLTPLASGITQTEAYIVAPVGYAESVYFEYGTIGSQVTKISGGSCVVTADNHCEAWTARAHLTGLKPGTTYGCRGVAKYKRQSIEKTCFFTTLN